MTARLIVLISLLVGAVPTAALAAPGHEMVRLIVGYEPGVTEADAAVTEAAVAGQRRGQVRRLGANVIEVPARQAARAAERLERSSDVAYVEVEGELEIESLTLTDPLLSDQWGVEQVGLPGLWTTSATRDVVVAVLDTGIDATNPELDEVVLPGWNAITGTAAPVDDHGHGTQVAGVIAAEWNEVGTAGACGSCTILPVKVAGSDGRASWSNVASGITWAVDQGAELINISITGSSGGTTLQNAVDYAAARGVVVVAAAGNNGSSAPHYPAAFDGVVAVAGSDVNDGRYSWSNYGSWVDVAAPGCNKTVSLDHASFGNFCGTSSATPLMVGALGSYLSVHDGATATDAVAALGASAAPVGDWVELGRVDVHAFATEPATNGAEPVDEPVEEPMGDSTTEPEQPTDATDVPAAATTLVLRGQHPTRVVDVPDTARAVLVTGPRGQELTLVLRSRSGHVVASNGGRGAVELDVAERDADTLELTGRGKVVLTIIE